MKPKQVRQYSVEDPTTYGVERGHLLMRRLKEIGVDLEGRILDVGCGYGGISIACAEKGSTVCAFDIDSQNLEVVKKRHRSGKAGPGKVLPFQGSVLAIPLTDSVVDLALMLGVVEWVGYSDPRPTVWQVQISALKEVARVLRPGGSLVIGSKNRLFPRYLWRDGQLKKPLLNILPRGLANLLSMRIFGCAYRGHVHSYWAWKRLVREAGLLIQDICVPIYTYQYPLVLAKPWHKANIKKRISTDGELQNESVRSAAFNTNFPIIRTIYYQLMSSFQLLGLGAGSFIFLCRKPEQKIDSAEKCQI